MFLGISEECEQGQTNADLRDSGIMACMNEPILHEERLGIFYGWQRAMLISAGLAVAYIL